MDKKIEDGKVVTTMTFSECFFGYDDPEISKEIINTFDNILLYSQCDQKENEIVKSFRTKFL